MTVIRPADMDALQNALDNNNVSIVSISGCKKTYIIKRSLINLVVMSGISFLHGDSYKSISQMHRY